MNVHHALLQSVHENVKTLVGLATTPRSNAKFGLKRNLRLNLQADPECVSFVSNQVAGLAATFNGYVYCPFCPTRHSKQRQIKAHLQQSHKAELDRLRAKDAEGFVVQSCPVCPARFYSQGVRIEHLATFHEQHVVGIWETLTCGGRRGTRRCSLCLATLGCGLSKAREHLLAAHADDVEVAVFRRARWPRTDDTSIQKEHVTECLSSSPVTRSLSHQKSRFRHQMSLDDDGDPDAYLDDLSITPERHCFQRRCRPASTDKKAGSPKFTSTPLKRRKRFGWRLRDRLRVLFAAPQNSAPTHPPQPLSSPLLPS